jgi:hypothetical protein
MLTPRSEIRSSHALAKTVVESGDPAVAHRHIGLHLRRAAADHDSNAAVLSPGLQSNARRSQRRAGA